MTAKTSSNDADRLAVTTTRAAARAWLAARFAAAGIAGADLDARLLLCAACGIDHVGLLCDPHQPLGADPADRIERFAIRRLAREPVSRILGRREFWGLSFAIGPGVLDPRPDTEVVVAAVLGALGDRREAPLRLLDLGTGSGAILAALLHECPHAYGIGIDRSESACRIAAANLAALGLAHRAAVLRGSWDDALAGRFDAVVSNPPYIPREDIGGLAQEVRGHDPAEALDGGVDGLDAYRALVPRFRAALAPGGVAAVECGFDQAETVATLFRVLGQLDATVHRDLAGHGRVVAGILPD